MVISILNEELNKINIWLKANKLTLNVDKSHYMVFHRGKRKIDLDSPSLNDISLKKVKFTKFLGVIIGDQLKWTNHILYIKTKIAKGCGIILRGRKFFNRKTLQNLYHSFIFPYSIYCVEIWGSASDAHLLPLILLQKKIVRVIKFSPYLAHTKDIYLNSISSYLKIRWFTESVCKCLKIILIFFLMLLEISLLLMPQFIGTIHVININCGQLVVCISMYTAPFALLV